MLIDHAWGKEPCTLADIKNYRPKANSRSVGQVLPRPYKFAEARLVFSEMIDQLVMDLIERETRTKELSFWVSFDPISLEELPSYDGPVSLDYYGRLHPSHVVGTVRMAAHTSSAKDIRTALLYAFDRKVDPRLFIRRLGVVAGNLQAAMCSWTSSRITRLRREKSGCSVSFWRSGKSTDQLRRGLS